MSGGQFGFVSLPTRAPHGAHTWCLAAHVTAQRRQEKHPPVQHHGSFSRKRLRAAEARERVLITNKRGNVFRVGIFEFVLISSGSPHVLRAHMGVHRTCGKPDEIELIMTAIGVELNGSRRAP